ncbi:hypothetical protein QJS04_geneDACA019115 [Acorus gramineus]|uniref:Late embryogenesis abundant protein LEA-2 subgroup domain-containing protein n=1 Tax=Acorus gramineus TaxID=55184 RepID=A0AAV9A9S1_ACOGR|nr:hypothetical protein QJS04_geneDACA019115 [Acorus gramineus]
MHPQQSPPPPPPTPHHHLFHHRPHRRTRYYTHRLHDSLTSRFCKCFCSIFLSLLLLLGIILFVLFLSLRPHRPRFHLLSFSIPSLSLQQQPQPLSISFSVSDRNPNRHIGVYYDAMRASIFYRDRLVGKPAMLRYPFYQPPKNTTVINGTAESGPEGVVVNEYVWPVVGFRLELTSTIRFRLSTWDTHHHSMHVGCDVMVGSDGVVLPASKEKRCSIYFS